MVKNKAKRKGKSEGDRVWRHSDERRLSQRGMSEPSTPQTLLITVQVYAGTILYGYPPKYIF